MLLGPASQQETRRQWQRRQLRRRMPRLLCLQTVGPKPRQIGRCRRPDRTTPNKRRSGRTGRTGGRGRGTSGMHISKSRGRRTIPARERTCSGQSTSTRTSTGRGATLAPSAARDASRRPHTHSSSSTSTTTCGSGRGRWSGRWSACWSTCRVWGHTATSARTLPTATATTRSPTSQATCRWSARSVIPTQSWTTPFRAWQVPRRRLLRSTRAMLQACESRSMRSERDSPLASSEHAPSKREGGNAEA
mmetsp:Transcript_34986/g.70701  ORF Transcript_34986/g.70701 Transcript_34986/m.70701 type:complete len:248 (+) Transcript_34986:603-1346(+)